jgi:triosephosphate isomerase
LEVAGVQRPYVFGTNFKMNQTPAESASFYRALVESIEVPENVHLFVLPPMTSLAAVAEIAGEQPHSIWVGAQNVHWASEGAYTGEVSIRMLQALHLDFVLLGHAERRQIFHENDADLNKKVVAALQAGLRVLFALGETAEERAYGISGETVIRQLKIGLHEVPADHLNLLMIGYEPVWSIGAGGIPATPEAVQPMAELLRDALVDLYGDAGAATPILYGGSVNPENAATFTSLPDIDGLFVGRAGWTVEGYIATYLGGLEGYRAQS